MAKLNGQTRRYRASTADVRAAMRVRFCAPAFALFEEVGNSTGFSCSRHADAVVVSLWPSRGIWFHGFEIKASRQDWQKELATPEKAEAVAKNCDYWSLVTADEEIVHPGELPETWGHLTMRGGKLVTVKEATKASDFSPSRGFVAALLRRAHETIDGQVKTAFNDGRAEGIKDGNPVELSRERGAREALEGSIRDFEEASGIKLDMWNGGRIGEAVGKLLKLRNHFDRDPVEELERAAERLEIAAKTLRDHVDVTKRQAEIAGLSVPKSGAA